MFPLGGRWCGVGQPPAPNPSLQPTAYTRREQWCLAGVSPFVGWGALARDRRLNSLPLGV